MYFRLDLYRLTLIIIVCSQSDLTINRKKNDSLTLVLEKEVCTNHCIMARLLLLVAFTALVFNISDGFVRTSLPKVQLKSSSQSSLTNTAEFRASASASALRASSLTMKAAIPIPTGLVNAGAKRIIDTLVIVNPLRSVNNALKTIVIFIVAYISRAKSKIKKQIKIASNVMEQGWNKRGTGSRFSRTVEIWAFAITFLVKFVSF